MKRLLDIICSLFGLIVLSPIILIFMFLIYRQDKHSPFYMAPRVGKNGKLFTMVKLRSMVINADKSGVDSTSNDDSRITTTGRIIRRFKLDELMQLWNVLIGDMSLVGPRPNVKRETDLYTDAEKVLLTVKPGITDISSIVFSDEGDILEGRDDPDLAYNQLIRPWKSSFGLIYIDSRSLLLDFKLILITIVAIMSRNEALKYVVKELSKLGIKEDILSIAARKSALVPTPPPGTDKIVTKR